MFVVLRGLFAFCMPALSSKPAMFRPSPLYPSTIALVGLPACAGIAGAACIADIAGVACIARGVRAVVFIDAAMVPVFVCVCVRAGC